MSGHTELDNVNVSAASTFGGLVDVDANLDVFGTSTFTNAVTINGLLDINAGGRANTFKVEDLTENRVVIAGTGGELEDSENLTYNGSTLTISNTTDSTNTTSGALVVSGGIGVGKGIIAENGFVNVNVSSENIFASIVKITSDTPSSDKTSGALVVTGGAGIGGDLNVGGDIIAYAGSDLRLKTDINPIADAVNKVKSLRGVTYEWNENSDYEGQLDIGVIAQEVDALGLPGLIQERDNGYLAVRYERLVPLLIEAIKELSDKVDSLEERLNN